MEAFAFNATEQGLLIAAGALLVIQAYFNLRAQRNGESPAKSASHVGARLSAV